MRTRVGSGVHSTPLAICTIVTMAMENAAGQPQGLTHKVPALFILSCHVLILFRQFQGLFCDTIFFLGERKI